MNRTGLFDIAVFIVSVIAAKMTCSVQEHIDGLVKERRNSIVNALELRLFLH